MLLFGFPFLGLVSSSKLALAISLGFILIKPNKFNVVIESLATKKMGGFIVASLCVLCYTLFLTVLNAENDFSLFIKQLGGVMFIILVFVFYSVFRSWDIPTLIINAFILQSVFISLAILNQDFYEMTSSLRSEVALNHLKTYGRLRGSAISGYQFFGISTMYGFVLLYFILKKNLSKTKNIIVLLFLSLIGIISGRYTALAIILGLFIRFVFKSSFKSKFKLLFGGAIVITIFGVTLNNVYNNHLDDQVIPVVDYYLKTPIENAINNGSAETSSSNRLIEMYNDVEFSNIFCGDGRYLSKNNSGYYKSVDAGYLRILLYYGLFGIPLLFFLQYLILFKLSDNVTPDFFLKLAFFLYFVVLNLKGDVFFYSNNTLPIIIGFLYFYNHKMKKTTLSCSKT